MCVFWQVPMRPARENLRVYVNEFKEVFSKVTAFLVTNSQFWGVVNYVRNNAQ